MSGRYSGVHKDTKGPGDARPTALQIIEENNFVDKLQGKVALVTGTSSGIGIPTALALKAAGMRVIGAVRDLEKGKKALEGHLEDGKLELIHLDMDSLSSVRQCAKDFLVKSTTLNILVNNAAIMACPEMRTSDGFEAQFGTNHLAHFLLFQLLKPTLLASATQEFPSKVVNVSSTGHRYGEVQFDNLKLEGIYNPGLGYGQAKTSNIYMANEIDRRYASRHLRAFSLHPGGIWTGLQKYMDQELKEGYMKEPTVTKHMKTPEQGAATTIYAALDKDLKGKGGLYLEDCGVSEPVREGYGVLDQGYERWAYDEGKEKRLWKMSLQLVGLEDDD